MSGKHVVIIGSGFAGLSSACFLARDGFDVTVLEKHSTPGGRARTFQDKGFTFDMGPSWYWMPDVFERFFNAFGVRVSDQYDLIRLSPAFAVIFGQDDIVNVPAQMQDVYQVFESIEPGSAESLKRFMAAAKFKYDTGMRDLVYKPGLRWSEYLDRRVLFGLTHMGVLQPYADHVRKYFKDPRLIRLLEFPVLFLGGLPTQVPALYSLMAYAGIALGTWYPQGGMYRIVEAMYRLALNLGVTFQFDTNVTGIEVAGNRAQYVKTDKNPFRSDVVVGAADYHHIEQHLLSSEYRQYSEKYWDRRVLAPSALIFFLGIDRKVPRLRHHNLFFDAPFDQHAHDIYTDPHIPDEPLFYVCTPSVTDDTVAPAGCENLFVLVPLSTRLEDTEEARVRCFEKVMDRLERYTGLPVRDYIISMKSYAANDFKADYNALRGNAYGLANTLMQTAKLKPRIRSRKVNNLYFAGQLTVPGPGVPPALISGEIAAGLIRKEFGSSHKIIGHAAEVI